MCTITMRKLSTLLPIVFSSTGSGEEDDLDTGIDSFVIIDSTEAPPLTDDDLSQSATTPTPAHSEPLPSSEPEQRQEDQPPLQVLVEDAAQSREQLQESVNEQQGKDGVASPSTNGGETPPTPQATNADEPSTAQNEATRHSGSIQSGEGGDDDKAMAINTVVGDGSKEPRDDREMKEEEKIEQAAGIGVAWVEDGEQRPEAVSPPATGSLGQQAGLMGINEVGYYRYLVIRSVNCDFYVCMCVF